MNEYHNALFKGNTIDSANKQKIAEKYSELTGIPVEIVVKSNLRVTPYVFRRNLLKEASVGRYDSRYSDEEFNQLTFWPSIDASSDPWVKGAFNNGINDLLTRKLQFKRDMEYEVFSSRVQPWEYATNQFLDVTPSIARAMQLNPYLKLHIFHGYYDLATPFFATEYTINRMNITPSRKDNISESWYRAGHMMYLRKSELVKFTREARKFITGD
jgi:carboxypeptidase C (cathepsin A)